MKLQLALDRLTDNECREILEDTIEAVDWIEVGTGVIKEYGMDIVRNIRSRYPDAVIVADMKTCDAGEHEAVQAFKAGADITTVMAYSADQTITDMVDVSREYNTRVMVDLLGVTEQERIHELERLGVDLVSLHFGKDMQKSGSMDQSLFDLVKNSSMEVAVAGGINLHSLPDVLPHRPDTLIVGGAITKQKDRKKAAKQIKEAIKHYETYNTHRCT
ncbi:3-hexulose-6-phosphate synthase [Halobacillus campisalis]|uniref:3-hexulose-6-phosphate synthase n=1 Tax=Halobacillus campisalis TaxID=435909 RepID=A0ABW2JYL0_9BACI|nr:3-hexulose-6-phosphate synthase [Halobacillus campisalis]